MEKRKPANKLRLAVRVIVYGALVIAAISVWKKMHPANPNAIPSAGGKSLSIQPRAVGAVFLQRDPLWIDDRLGSTQETLGSVGCLVCSVAMAANALGEHTTPKELNAALSKTDGYTKDGWLVWSKLAPVFSERVEAVISDRPSHADMDDALQRGEFPLVKFFIYGVVPHWVVVVGKEGTDYLIHDPLEDTPEPFRLSEQAEEIHSVRYLRRRVANVR